MDTISSRESNTNFLPLVGIAVGAIALIFSIIALVKLANVGKDLSDTKSNISAKLDSLDTQVSSLSQLAQAASQAVNAANDTKTYANSLATQTQTGFNNISAALEKVSTRLDKLEAARVAVRPAPGGARGANATPVAGAGEYIVKAGDTSGTKIAAANGVKLADLMAVNPDVDWRRLRIGQHLKLPSKAGAQPAAQPAQ